MPFETLLLAYPLYRYTTSNVRRQNKKSWSVVGSVRAKVYGGRSRPVKTERGERFIQTYKCTLAPGSIVQEGEAIRYGENLFTFHGVHAISGARGVHHYEAELHEAEEPWREEVEAAQEGA